jgi:SAM-dependent methyltransferase
MGSEPPATPESEISPSAAYVTFTSQAYVAEKDEESTRATVAWLEEQSLHPFIQDVAVRSLARLALEPGEAVLDVGCGTAVFVPGLDAGVGAGGRVVGLDHAPALLAEARERLAAAGIVDRVELVEGDANNLPFDDATFDAAHCERVLMHLEEPSRAIQEMVRVVRPGGRVVAAEVFGAGATMDHPDVEASHLIESTMITGIRNPYMGIQLRALFIEAGLTEVHGDVVGYFEEELDQDEAEEYARIARELAARGRLDPARAEAAIVAMEDRRTRGAHCGLALIFVVSGRVPDGDRDGG